MRKNKVKIPQSTCSNGQQHHEVTVEALVAFGLCSKQSMTMTAMPKISKARQKQQKGTVVHWMATV